MFPLDEAYQGSGVIYGFTLPQTLKLYLQRFQRDPTDTLHITVQYLGNLEDLSAVELGTIMHIAGTVALRKWSTPIPARIQGITRFLNCSPDSPTGEVDACVLNVSSPLLSDFRDTLRQELSMRGMLKPDKYSFTPHVTLGYIRPDQRMLVDRLDPIDFTLNDFALAVAGSWVSYPLSRTL